MPKLGFSDAISAKMLVAGRTIKLVIPDLPHALAVGCWALLHAEFFKHKILSFFVHLIGQDTLNFIFMQVLFSIVVVTLDTLVLDSHFLKLYLDVLSLAFNTYGVTALLECQSLVLSRHFITNFARQPCLLCLPISYLFFNSLSIQACLFFSLDSCAFLGLKVLLCEPCFIFFLLLFVDPVLLGLDQSFLFLFEQKLSFSFSFFDLFLFQVFEAFFHFLCH